MALITEQRIEKGTQAKGLIPMRVTPQPECGE